MVNTSFKILIILFSIMLFSCNKEPVAQREYVYSYSFNNNCGGITWITVPNTFAPEQQYDGWFPSVIKLTADSICTVNLPDSIRQKKYLTLQVEIRDLDNGIWYQYHSERDSSIKKWNGGLNNAGQSASPGIYYWRFSLQDLDGVTHEESGILHLLY